MLRDMFKLKFIDLKNLINLIVSSKKEIDYDIIFDIIIKELLDATSLDEVANIMHEIMIPKSNFPNNMSLSYHFAHKLLSLLKSIEYPKQDIVNLLLHYPQEILFPLLIDEEDNTRSYSEKITYFMFPNIPKLNKIDKNINYLSGEDKCSMDHLFDNL